MRNTVGIIGGGAAGMMAAITAARQGAKVTILERNDRVGKKIPATGNGKCNLGNRNLTKDFYYGGDMDFIMDRLQDFGTEDTITFFDGLGLMLKEKNGYLYPASEQASVVLDVLRMELKELGIRVIYEYKVTDIRRVSDIAKASDSKKASAGQKASCFVVSDGQTEYTFDKVILACGGKAAPATGSDGLGFQLAKQLGHIIIPTVPALVQLRCKENFFKAVAGVRADAMLTVVKDGQEFAKERGELQLTDYGISGIPVFQFSRQVAYLLKEQKEVEVHIDFLPDYGEEEMELLYQRRRMLQGDRTVEEFFTGMLNKKVMQLFGKLAGLNLSEKLDKVPEKAVRKVFALCKDWKVTVMGTKPYENAQVCAGGISLKEITENMESKIHDGLFFAGEMLDVDGKCGGYNLQWAWTSGYLAGKEAGRKEE